MKRRRSVAGDILLGAAAGATATWLMDLATTVLYEKEPKEIREREDRARGEKTAYEIVAEKAASLAGRRLTAKERKAAGGAIHWTTGIGAGALYGGLRAVLPFRIGSGLAYGTLFWLVVDETALSLLGLTPPPSDFPWQTHARGLAGHLILGGVIETVFDVADLTTI